MLRAKLSAMPRLRGRRGAFDGVGLEGALCGEPPVLRPGGQEGAGTSDPGGFSGTEDSKALTWK